MIPIKLASFFFFGLYKGMWRYTGIYDLENLVKACVISSGIIVFILVLEIREDDDGEYYHLVTLWKSTKQEEKLYEEYS